TPAAGRVMPGKVAAFAQVYAHGAKIARRDHIDEHPLKFSGQVHSSLCLEAPTSVTVQRKHIANSGRFDARQGAHATQDLLQDSAPTRSIASIVVIDLERGSAGRLESQIDIEHVEKATQQQARADQQHAGQSYFGDDQHSAQALMLSARAHSLAHVLESILEITGRYPEAGSNPEENSSRYGNN